MVVPTDAELRQLLDRFVPVRMIQMGGVDLDTFQFDPHLSWSLFFMNGDKTIYGRYGTTHPNTKRSEKDSNPTPSLAGMKAAMRKALEIHEGYGKDPREWTPALKGKTGKPVRWRFTEKNPAAKKYGRLKRVNEGEEEGCVHCHEVHRTEIDSHFMKKLEIPDRLMWLYPRPRVLGLEMDKDHCARVKSVAAGSIAAKAGLRAGSEIVTLNYQPLVSIADLQWVLHTFPDEGGTLAAEVLNNGKGVDIEMKLPPGWRRNEDFAWRYRTFGYAQWLWTGATLQDVPEGVRIQNHTPGWYKRPNRDAQGALRPGDVITKVDGRTGMDRSAFLAYLMREKKLGSTVKIELLRRGKKKKASFKIPKKQPEVQGY